MKTKKSCFSRALVLMMAFMLVFTMMPSGMFGVTETAYAGEEAKTAKVYLTVSNQGNLATDKNGDIMADMPVTVTDLNSDDQLTYDEALKAAHNQYKNDGDYSTSTSEYGTSVSKLWGTASGNLLFFNNNVGLKNGVAVDTVKEGDHLFASINQDNVYYADWYTYFDSSEKTVYVNEEFTLELKGYQGMAGGEPEAVPGVQIGTSNAGIFTQISDKTTGEDGKVKLSFDAAGTYYVTATGTVSDEVNDYSQYTTVTTITANCPIMAPVCKVTVANKDLDTLRFKSGSAASAAEYTLSPTFNKEGYNYTLYVPYNKSSVYASASLSATSERDIKVKYTNTSNVETTVNLKSSNTSLSKLISSSSFTGNTLKVSVGGEEKYTVTIKRIATLKGVTVKSKTGEAEAEGVALTPDKFSADTKVYTAKINADDKIIITPSLITGTECTVNDSPLSGSKLEITPNWDENRKFVAQIKVQEPDNTDSNAANTYSINFQQYPESISISTPPSKTEYNFGEKFDPTGMKVTANYQKGEPVTLDLKNISYTPAGSLTDETEVVIKYENQTAEQAITVTGASLEGDGTEANPYLIKDTDDVKKLSDYVAAGVTFEGKFIKLAADNIELPSTDWVPVGTSKTNPFSGTFDGDNKCIVVPEGGTPLFGCVKNATIKNLEIYGKKIAGYGLVNGYQEIKNTSTLIENVTLKEGSQTLQSGFIGGWASGTDLITIRNCKVEKNVVIGYDKNQKWIGSFGGEFNGIIENCISYATVYGTDFVGGIVADKGQSMGKFEVKNCEFYGTVIATGNYVGGIVGHGYGGTKWGFTPNPPAVTIENSFVAGNVSGSNYVGGILGGDAAVQYWDNGAGSIRNNHFYGKVAASADDACVGGIIGYMKSLNKNIVIENNYYINTCGAANGIGKVIYIDTNKASHETSSGATYFDTSENKKSGISGASKTNLNRTDDPLGADADALAKAMSSADFKNGTVASKLNLSDSSLHNWIQDELYPIHSMDHIIYKLEVTEGYVKDYYIGDNFDFNGAKITATWSDGSTTEVASEDVSVSFDNKTRGQKTVTIAYGAAKAEVIVVVLAKTTGTSGDKINVQFTLLGDTVHDESEGVHTKAANNLTEWIGNKSYVLQNNSTVEDLLKLVDSEYENLTFDATWSGKYGSTYIKGVTFDGVELSEHTNGPNSGWQYSVNNNYPEVGVSAYYLNNGDKVIFHYTDDYSKEESATSFGGGGLAGDTTAVTTDTKTATTTSPTDVKVSEKTNADGSKESVATVTVSADNQKEILKQAKSNKSKEIILQVSKDSVKDASKADVQLDKSFIESVLKDTDAKLTVKTPFGDKTYTQDELKALAAAATGKTVSLEIVKSEKTDEELKAEQLEAAKATVAKASMKARSSKTTKGNVKVVFKPDTKTQNFIQEMKDMGYTVKYRFYRSTKKSSGYKAMLTKTSKTYTNTSGKKGTRYYYKVQVRVYDENGKCVAKTALKQCKYACRIFG